MIEWTCLQRGSIFFGYCLQYNIRGQLKERHLLKSLPSNHRRLKTGVATLTKKGRRCHWTGANATCIIHSIIQAVCTNGEEISLCYKIPSVKNNENKKWPDWEGGLPIERHTEPLRRRWMSTARRVGPQLLGSHTPPSGPWPPKADRLYPVRCRDLFPSPSLAFPSWWLRTQMLPSQGPDNIPTLPPPWLAAFYLRVVWQTWFLLESRWSNEQMYNKGYQNQAKNWLGLRFWKLCFVTFTFQYFMVMKQRKRLLGY